MAFLLGFLVIALVMLLVVLVVAAALLRTLLVPALAALGAGLLAAAGGLGHPLAIGLLAGLLVLLARRRRRSAARIRAVRMRPSAVTIEGRPMASAPSDPLADCWSRARRLAPGHRRRLEAARGAGAALLGEAAAAPLDLELHEAAMLLERHAPELVARAEALCAADPAARRPCIEQMVTALEELTGVTGELGERRRGRLRDAFATVRRHVADRTGSPR